MRGCQTAVNCDVKRRSIVRMWTDVRTLWLSDRPATLRAMTSPNGDARPRPAELGYRAPIPYRAVFEFSPSGIIVTNAAGEVQGANLGAKRMLGEALDRVQLRCCDLFDCRRAGTPLAGHCITELALNRPDPLPDLRVDIGMRGGSTGSVWVTAASVGGAEAAVIIQLR